MTLISCFEFLKNLEQQLRLNHMFAGSLSHHWFYSSCVTIYCVLIPDSCLCSRVVNSAHTPDAHTMPAFYVSMSCSSFLSPFKQLKGRNWEKPESVSRLDAVFEVKIQSFPGLCLPLLGIRAWWQMGATLVLFPAGFSPRLGWAQPLGGMC